LGIKSCGGTDRINVAVNAHVEVSHAGRTDVTQKGHI
jgi:hypothetical protein